MERAERSQRLGQRAGKDGLCGVREHVPIDGFGLRGVEVLECPLQRANKALVGRERNERCAWGPVERDGVSCDRSVTLGAMPIT